LIGRARQQWETLPIRFEAADAEALRFEDASFDAVWSERVLQHLSRPATATAEMARRRATSRYTAISAQ
jgi:ubiquinone/menaquinone biosynthesis C-methylase UbiE